MALETQPQPHAPATLKAHDDAFMRRALLLAERGRCTAAPNPWVGCVLVRNGQVVGEGYHRRAGEPHAEAWALAAAGPLARHATAYVTLEPCAHVGRTPPCVNGLIQAGVSRVVVAVLDPDPRVAGRVFLSSHTVAFHLRHVFWKLGVTSRVQLARMAAEQTA